MRSANCLAFGLGTPVGRFRLRRGQAGFLRVPRARGRLTRRACRRGRRHRPIGVSGRGLRLARIRRACRLRGSLAGAHGGSLRLRGGWGRPDLARNRASHRKVLMNGISVRGRAVPTVDAPGEPARSSARRHCGRNRSGADCPDGDRVSRREDTSSGHGGLDASGKRRRRGTAHPRAREAQVAEWLYPKPRKRQHREPNQEQHADRTAHQPQHPSPPARLIDEDVWRKTAHALPNTVTVGSTRWRQDKNTASTCVSRALGSSSANRRMGLFGEDSVMMTSFLASQRNTRLSD